MPVKPKFDPHLEIAHVLFIDVVGYSKLLVNEQRAVIEELNQLVRKTPQVRKSDAAGKLIRIPAGDGMALVFFQTPEEPVQCAMEIAKTLKNRPNVQLRMGVHSGPVDQMKDVNDRINVAGAGINIAQGMSDAALGRKEEALKEVRRAAELLPIKKDAMTGAEILRNLAITYAWTGEKDLAIEQLEELLPLYGPISYGQLRLHPWWDPLRGDPRFEKIVEEAKKPVPLK